jgi:hypothetical protein
MKTKTFILFAIVMMLMNQDSNLYAAIHHSSLKEVTFLHLNLKQQEKEVVVEFQTASQTDVAVFVIQRSEDAINWQDAIYVTGAGSTNDILEYMACDRNSKCGLYYYRIKSIDYDGDENYSEVRSIYYESVYSNSVIYPVPSSDILTIVPGKDFSNEATAGIYDLTGKLMMQLNRSEFNNINISNLPEGIYTVVISDLLHFESVSLIKSANGSN